MRRKSKIAWVSWEEYTVINEVPPDVLQHIGAIILEWNFIEDVLDDILAAAIRCHPNLAAQITSRIHGMDGKLDIIRKALNPFPIFTDDERTELRQTLNAVENYKKYRDAIAHLRLPGPESEIGKSNVRRGSTYEVLVTVKALSILYAHLESLGNEVVWLYRITERCAFTQDDVDDQPWLDPKKLRSGSEFQDGFAQFRSHRNHRQSLPPLPELPDEPEAPPATGEHQVNPGQS